MSILAALWQPIVLSAVLVFILSAIIHMVLKYHNSDYSRLPNEDAVRAAIRSGNPEPAAVRLPLRGRDEGDGVAGDEAEVHRGADRGALPQAAGPFTMGPALTQWFLFTLMVSLFVAYVAAHSIPPGAEYLHVFRVVGAVAFLAYAAASCRRRSGWGSPGRSRRRRCSTGCSTALVTAGTFGWLWPE